MFPSRFGFLIGKVTVLPSDHPMVMMWKSALQGNIRPDTEEKYQHLITYTFDRVTLPFGGSPSPDLAKKFTLMERKSHSQLYDDILSLAETNTRDERLRVGLRTGGLILVGPPGIGKSCNLNLIFLRCASINEVTAEGPEKRGKPVIVCDRSVYDAEDRFLTFYPGPEPRVEASSERPSVLKDHKTVYLYDPPHLPTDNKQPVICDAFTVVASSPNERNYKAIEKENMGKVYAYRWEAAEAKEAEMVLNLPIESAVVKHCGHSLRLLTTGLLYGRNASKAVDAALSKVISLQDAQNLVDAITFQTCDSTSLSHKLFTTIPKKGERFYDFEICPVSDYVRDELKAKLVKFLGFDALDDLVKLKLLNAAKGGLKTLIAKFF